MTLPAISVAGLSYSYAAGPQALEAVRFEVASGERVGLVGPNGAGKTTLFLCLAGVLRFTTGTGVLAMRPEILLLDEPSIHLDPRGRRELIRLIGGLGVTQVIAAHDLEMILETCPRVLVIDQGSIVADGPSRKLLADAALMEAHG